MNRHFAIHTSHNRRHYNQPHTDLLNLDIPICITLIIPHVAFWPSRAISWARAAPAEKRKSRAGDDKAITVTW